MFMRRETALQVWDTTIKHRKHTMEPLFYLSYSPLSLPTYNSSRGRVIKRAQPRIEQYRCQYPSHGLITATSTTSPSLTLKISPQPHTALRKKPNSTTPNHQYDPPTHSSNLQIPSHN